MDDRPVSDIKKEDNRRLSSFFISSNIETNYRPSSETVSLFLPFALRWAIILRPLFDDILSRKPCLFLRFLFDG
jgi:hypothetical protein